MRRRENTFRIDYANVPKKPDYAKVHKFCGTVLGLKNGEVLRIQCSRSLGCAFVKVVDLELAQKVCAENDNKHEITVDGKKYPLRITMEDGAVDVKLFDLSEDVPDELIIEFLEQYGDVINVREQLCGADFHFAGISTGVRIARMVVKRNIESWVTIDGELTLLSFFGQRQTCKHCREFIHVGASCVQNKKLLVQKSYADAAKQIAPMPNPKPPQKRTQNQSPMLATRLPKQDRNLMPPPSPKPQQQRPQQSQSLLFPPSPIDLEINYPLLPSTQGTQPSDSGSMAITPGQRPPADSGETNKTVSGKSDGNETDASTTSSSSKRSLRGRPNKKQRVGSDEERV